MRLLNGVVLSCLLSVSSSFAADSSTGTSASTSISSSTNSFAISCIDANGKVANGGANVCPAILSKCSDLKTAYEKSVRGLLTAKIWGYYQGKDVDLDKSSSSQMVGTAMSTPLCSVVGHKIKYTGSNADFETTSQTIGLKSSCGVRPHAKGHQGGSFLGIGGHKGNVLNLSFVGNEGKLWTSYMLGAYPWLIRKHTSDVLTAIKPDLSNLGDVIQGNAAVKADLATLNNSMSSFYKDLAAESKDVCTSGAKDVVARCTSGAVSVSEPAIKLCTMVQSLSILNTGALPNILVQEIMVRVQKQYDELFATILSHKNSTYEAFFDDCEKVAGNSNGFLGLTPRKKYSGTASCIFDGQDFITNADYEVSESNGKGRGSRRQTLASFVSVPDGKMTQATFGAGVHTVNHGFAGLIEYIIRVKICDQKKLSDDSVCDSVNVPDKPEDAK